MNPAQIIADTVEQAVDSKIAKSQRGGVKTVTATYCGKDADGKPYVQIPGADDTTPIRRMSVQADIGDTVTVTIENGMAVVDSNVSNPSASSSNLQAVDVKASKAQQTADEAVEKVASVSRKTEAAMAQALSASTIAEEAQEVADATNQHFWDDDNGAHVTDVTQEEWTTALEDNFSDLSTNKPYHNSLFNSLGMLFRSALNNLVAITRSAIAFYDGNGNQASNIVASFGANGVQIGKDTEANMEIKPTYMVMNAEDGTEAARIEFTKITHHGDVTQERYGAKITAGSSYSDVSILPSVGTSGFNDLLDLTGTNLGSVRLYDNSGAHLFLNSVHAGILGGSSTDYISVTDGVYFKYTSRSVDKFIVDGNGNISCVGTATFGSPLAVSSGGTGESTINAAANAMVNGLTLATGGTLTDSANIITETASGGTDTYYRRPLSHLWTYIKGKIDAYIGTTESDSQTVSASSSATTSICSVTLAAGTWAVSYTVKFDTSATGRRSIKLSTASNDSTASAERSATIPAASGGTTIVSRTAVVSPTSSTVYYLNCWHNAGAALSVDGSIQAVRIA